ncbi:glycosyltransferase [Nocardioides mangrovicus]|uniref:Glycosyltransferase n=1 Tax=Nocardioides mangrovicus TaxID=2478913 RepID=A0A3L8NZV0_9ACTN|nr:glycosyltransferase [Nocardioides mangrovicus]RLV47638.1 glycosyltransferase [Nocardioides mangrovicus]
MVLNAVWAIPVGDVGGVARHAADVAGVGVPGWRLRFLVPDGPVVDLLRSRDADVVVGRFGPAHGLTASLAALRRASAGADLVHTHLAYADVVGALAKPRGGVLVTTEHGIADTDLVYHGSPARSRARAALHRLRLRRADLLLAVSQATLDVVRRKWRPPASLPTHVVHNGVDPLPEPPAEPGLHVASLARLAPEKRLRELVAGFAVLAARRPEARLTLAGVGPLHAELVEQVGRLGLTDRVDLPGFVDAASLLESVHVLAQLSVWENCSYSLLDAVVRGRGVVASAVGGNPEILPGRCLVDPADAAAVADALEAQGTQPEQRPTLLADWPDVAAMAKQVGEAYAEVAQ